MAVAGVWFSPLFVCVFCMRNSSKTDAARITKHYIKMFHDDSWQTIYLGKRSKVKVTRQKNSAGMGLCTLVSARFF